MSYALLTALVLCLGAAPQGDDEARSKAAQLLDEGNKLFDEKHFERALAKFQEAYASFASPKILLNLAEAQRELGRLDRAATAYEQFVEETKEKGDAKFREVAEGRLKSLSESVARVELIGYEDGDHVKIGEESITPRDGHLFVMPGLTQLSVSRTGEGTFLRELIASAGQKVDVILLFTAPKEPPVLAVSPPPPPPSAGGGDETPALDARPENRRLLAQEPDASATTQAPITSEWWFWTAIGAVAVTGIVIIAIAASSGGDDFVPQGELGSVSTASWQPFTVGGLR